MHRPKKNKVHNPTLPDDQQVDDRHLVDAEDSPEISFEDRVNIYWRENKGFITGCIIALLLIIVGYQGMRIYKEHVESEQQATYAEARAEGTLADFARANSGQTLGGFAALTTADAAYTDEDYATALEFYSLAAEGLDGNILEGRARLGEAFARFYSGAESDGLAQLNSVAADTSLPDAARAEAAYHLAVEADAAGRSEEFERYAAQINETPLAAQWQQRLGYYRQQVR